MFLFQTHAWVTWWVSNGALGWRRVGSFEFVEGIIHRRGDVGAGRHDAASLPGFTTLHAVTDTAQQVIEFIFTILAQCLNQNIYKLLLAAS